MLVDSSYVTVICFFEFWELFLYQIFKQICSWLVTFYVHKFSLTFLDWLSWVFATNHWSEILFRRYTNLNSSFRGFYKMSIPSDMILWGIWSKPSKFFGVKLCNYSTCLWNYKRFEIIKIDHRFWEKDRHVGAFGARKRNLENVLDKYLKILRNQNVVEQKVYSKFSYWIKMYCISTGFLEFLGSGEIGG
jgi:hypothetical protein